ncbi:hypothetical protein [Chromobacterium phragmitis]|uniref:DUF3618 domain-containing protein n=1 Tax=Chromobacterium phragmitis TaxID=2202141 RepID=A0ABV0IN29_9NEIS|nr:hypothetical protein [Chromobacterium phragmitis]
MRDEVDRLERELVGLIDERFMGVEDGLARLLNMAEAHQKQLSTSHLSVQRFLPQFGMCVAIVALMLSISVGLGAWYAQEARMEALARQARLSQVERGKAEAFDRILDRADPRLVSAMREALRRAQEPAREVAKDASSAASR